MVVIRHEADSQRETTSRQRALDRLEGRLDRSGLPPGDGGLAGIQPSRQFPLGQACTSTPLPDDASTCHTNDDISYDIAPDRREQRRRIPLPSPVSAWGGLSLGPTNDFFVLEAGKAAEPGVLAGMADVDDEHRAKRCSR